jgi:hypothetical protein
VTDQPTKRIWIDLPISLLRRFKAACAATNRPMIKELLALIERHTVELEAMTQKVAQPANIDRRRSASVTDIADALRRTEARDGGVASGPDDEPARRADAEPECFTEVLEKVRDVLMLQQTGRAEER